jgi:DNA-directed RNA polymerase subunit RPC12/RpoP
MAVRVCPHCKAEISAPESAARSNDITCPKCGARLEVSSGARTLSTIAGLAAGAIVWKLSSGSGGSGGDLAAIAPTLYAFLAFGIVSPLVLMVTANLRNAPLAPVAEPVHAAAGHGTSGHSVVGHGAHH